MWYSHCSQGWSGFRNRKQHKNIDVEQKKQQKENQGTENGDLIKTPSHNSQLPHPSRCNSGEIASNGDYNRRMFNSFIDCLRDNWSDYCMYYCELIPWAGGNNHGRGKKASPLSVDHNIKEKVLGFTETRKMKEKKSEECEMGFQWFKWVSKKREIEKGTKNNNAIIPAQDNLKEELGLEKPKNVQASVNSQDGRKDSRKSQLVQRPTVSTGEHTNETEQSSQRHPKGSSGIFAMMIVLAVVVAAVWSGWEQAGLMDGSPTRTQDEFEKIISRPSDADLFTGLVSKPSQQLTSAPVPTINNSLVVFTNNTFVFEGHPSKTPGNGIFAVVPGLLPISLGAIVIPKFRNSKIWGLVVVVEGGSIDVEVEEDVDFSLRGKYYPENILDGAEKSGDSTAPYHHSTMPQETSQTKRVSMGQLQSQLQNKNPDDEKGKTKHPVEDKETDEKWRSLFNNPEFLDAEGNGITTSGEDDFDDEDMRGIVVEERLAGEGDEDSLLELERLAGEGDEDSLLELERLASEEDEEKIRKALPNKGQPWPNSAYDTDEWLRRKGFGAHKIRFEQCINGKSGRTVDYCVTYTQLYIWTKEDHDEVMTFLVDYLREHPERVQMLTEVTELKKFLRWRKQINRNAWEDIGLPEGLAHTFGERSLNRLLRFDERSKKKQPPLRTNRQFLLDVSKILPKLVLAPYIPSDSDLWNDGPFVREVLNSLDPLSGRNFVSGIPKSSALWKDREFVSEVLQPVEHEKEGE